MVVSSGFGGEFNLRRARSPLHQTVHLVCRRLFLLQGVLVDHAVLHDDDEILRSIAYEIDILQRVAVDQQQVGVGAFLLLVDVGVN